MRLHAVLAFELILHTLLDAVYEYESCIRRLGCYRAWTGAPVEQVWVEEGVKQNLQRGPITWTGGQNEQGQKISSGEDCDESWVSLVPWAVGLQDVGLHDAARNEIKGCQRRFRPWVA